MCRYRGEPTSRDGALRNGIPFSVLVNSPNSFQPSTSRLGILYAECWLSAIQAGAVDQLAFVLGAQTPLWSTVDELTRFASHVHELGHSLHRPFGSSPHPTASILSTTPSAAVIETKKDYEPLRIRAWRETVPGESNGCVHIVVVNIWTGGAVQFTAMLEGLQPVFPGFKWPCSGYSACEATRLFAPGPSLNITEGGILAEDFIGPGQTTHYRIGCDAAVGSRPHAANNMIENPSFEQTGGDPSQHVPPSPAVSGEIFMGQSEWEVPRMVDGHDYRAALMADTTVAHTGRHSLKVHVPSNTPFVFSVTGKAQYRGGANVCPTDGRRTELSVRLQYGVAYIVSLKVQASPAGTKVAVMKGSWGDGCSYPGVLPPPAGGCPYRGIALHEVEAGRGWSTLHTVIENVSTDNCTALQIRVSPAGAEYGAVAWIDDVYVAPVQNLEAPKRW